MEVDELLKHSNIHHIGILVHDPKALIELFQCLGWNQTGTAANEEFGVQTHFLSHENHTVQIEFIVPVDNESLNKQLKQRGNHVHHLAIELDGLENGISDLTRLGYQFLSEQPVSGYEDREVIFLHPLSSKGVLIEFMGRKA